MSYIQSIASEQTWLLPYSIDELVEENNPVRVIRAYVDSLPMEELGFVRAVPAGTGRPGYDPSDILKLPPGFQPHNSLGRPQKPARVRVTLRRNPEDMQRRKELAEHPFGTVKWYDGAHYFLCRGKEKVSAEIALSFLAYNLRRAINLLGAGALVAHFNERNRKNRG